MLQGKKLSSRTYSFWLRTGWGVDCGGTVPTDLGDKLRWAEVCWSFLPGIPLPPDIERIWTGLSSPEACGKTTLMEFFPLVPDLALLFADLGEDEPWRPDELTRRLSGIGSILSLDFPSSWLQLQNISVDSWYNDKNGKFSRKTINFIIKKKKKKRRKKNFSTLWQPHRTNFVHGKLHVLKLWFYMAI